MVDSLVRLSKDIGISIKEEVLHPMAKKLMKENLVRVKGNLVRHNTKLLDQVFTIWWKIREQNQGFIL